jgi:flagellar basal-body rod protein FlgC
MNLFGVMQVSGSALGAERIRSEVTAANLANAESTRTEQGGPYQRKQVIFQSRNTPTFRNALAGAGSLHGKEPSGVVVRDVVTDPAAPIMRYEPTHPDANEAGYVAYPNINPVAEMTDLLSAVRSYQMNVAAVNSSKQMISESLDILR